MDIHKEVDDLAAVQEFNAQPLTLKTRVRLFLLSLFGAAGSLAQIDSSYALPSGEHAHFALFPGGDPTLLVERGDGFVLAAPIPEEDQSETSGENEPAAGAILLLDPANAYHIERKCVVRIIDAMKELSTILESADVAPEQKSRLQSEMVHACKHLQVHLENMRRQL